MNLHEIEVKQAAKYLNSCKKENGSFDTDAARGLMITFERWTIEKSDSLIEELLGPAHTPAPEPSQKTPEPTPVPAPVAVIEARNDEGLDEEDSDEPADIEAGIAALTQPVANLLPDVPDRLKKIPNWVWWKLETRDGKTTKVPYIAGTNRHASSTDPTTWTTFENAVKDAVLGAESGVGFVVNGAEQILGFDLDGCRNSQTGELTEWADSIIEALNSYTEVTPSETGVRVWVRGVLPGSDRVFNLNPAVGFGSKVKIEVFESGRYFTVTGNSVFEDAGDVELCDLTAAYQLCCDIRSKYPVAAKENPSTPEVKSTPVRVVTEIGAMIADKLVLLMTGQVKSTEPCIIEDGRGNSIQYPTHSEADLALATCLAIKYGDKPELIAAEFCKSPLCREKWLSREDYRNETIKKAIASASTQPDLIPAIQENTEQPRQLTATDILSADEIPPFDLSVITGIYAKFVELITRGTTLTPQFAFLAAKVVVGARMAGKVHFESLDVEPRYYGAAIGESGSGKGEAWRRMMQILHISGSMSPAGAPCGIKIINSADSGAGIKDAFFEFPEAQPILCYVDEVESLGHKSADTRNPSILDTVIELANSTQISRTKAKKKGDTFSGSRTKNDARFCMYMCGQNGDVYMKAFAGRTRLGMYDRLYPEYSTVVEVGELPPVAMGDAYLLLSELNSLDYSGTMTMSPEARTLLDSFWATQPKDVKAKARWKNNLVIDAYMAAFGRKVKQVAVEDMTIAIKIFTRQLVIREVCFRSECPDRVGYYIGKIKDLTERMYKQLKAGVPPEQVALSRRDFEKQTHAHRDNETHIFERAWRTYEPTYLTVVKVQKTNGQQYFKYLPSDE